MSPADDLAEVSGTVEKVIYRNDETGYIVCSIRPVDSPTGALVTVTGRTAAIWEGEELTARGEWVNDARHGRQFKASEMVNVAPSSVEGIRRFLSSRLIKGIGEEYAKRIVDHFGADTLNVLEHNPRRLGEVRGIGPTRIKKIASSWNAQKGVREVMIFLQSHGVGTGQAARVYRQYGADSIAVVRKNPYRLCRDVWGFGFITADSIAQKIGVAHDSPQRATAGLLHCLQTMADDGHCFGEEAEVLLRAQDMLGISVEKLTEALSALEKDGAVIRDGTRIYVRELFNYEQAVARRLVAIAGTPLNYDAINADKAIAWAEGQMKLVLAEAQRRAIASSITNKVSVITGGPGVGKTTIIRALAMIFNARRLKVKLAAPTGRAAKRMTESTGFPAQTIHRLLKYLPAERKFNFNEKNPIEADVLVVDEMSMVDIELMDSLLRALPLNATVVFVGDTDQLPSVGPGNVLRDMISSEAMPCTRLTSIYRQDQTGLIVRNAHMINEGGELIRGDENSDFFFIDTYDADRIVERVCDLVTRRIPNRFRIPPSDIQVLTPMRRNSLGADNLNAVLQKAVNRAGLGIRRGMVEFKVGDRVMQMRNNYDKDVFNGDVGFITAIDAEERSVVVDYDGLSVTYESGELDEIVLSYASTIHKSQGSEYPAVVIVLSTQHFKLLQRNLLYTAVTRGRRLVCIVGSSKAVGMAIANNEVRERHTALADRLRNLRGQ